MTLVVASSTARASRSASGSANPATSAMRLVSSRTRPRYAVSLGRLSISAGLARARPRGGAAGLRRASSPRALATLGRTLRGPEARDGVGLGGEHPVEVVEAEDVEDVLDGLVGAGQAQVPAVAADLLDGPHHGAQARAGDVGEAGAVDDYVELFQ